MSDLQPKPGGLIDLAVLLMSTDPRLTREAYAVVEGARERGFAARVVELDAASSDQLVLSSLAALDPAVTALGVEASTADRCIGAAEALLQRERPVLLFGRIFHDELERRKVPVEAATGIVVGPARPTVLDFLRSLDGSAPAPVAGLDRLDGDFRPRPPRDAVEGLAFPRFHEADLLRLRREGLPIRMGYGCPRRCAFCGEQPREGKPPRPHRRRHRRRDRLPLRAERAPVSLLRSGGQRRSAPAGVGLRSPAGAEAGGQLVGPGDDRRRDGAVALPYAAPGRLRGAGVRGHLGVGQGAAAGRRWLHRGPGHRRCPRRCRGGH